MLRLTDVIQPKPDEHVQAVFRRHRGLLLPPLLFATLLIAIPFFLLFSLTRQGAGGIIVFAVLLAGGVVIALRTLYAWDANALILTSKRLIRVTQNGFWNRVVQEVSLTSIHELVCESKGILETLFRVGTLRVRAAGVVSEIAISRIPSPERARAHIESLRHPPSEGKLDAASPEKPLDLRAEVHALVEKAQVSTLETVKALLEKRVL
jgi:hypothetical protein